MKKYLMLIAAAMVAGAVRAATETVDGMTWTYQIGGTWTIQTSFGTSCYTLGKSQAVITAVAGNSKNVVVPSVLGGASVVIIGNQVFQNNTSVMKITIPESVGMLGNATFDGCIALVSCNIPSGVSQIPSNCFRGCSNLTKITLPATLYSIGYQAFYSCSNLKAIDLPNGVSVLDNCVFAYSGLTSIIIPESVTSMGYSCFFECDSLQHVQFSNKMATVPAQSFEYCYMLSEITGLDNVTSVGGSAFDACRSLQEIVLPAKCKSLGDNAFYHTSCRIVFNGEPPAGLISAQIGGSVVYPKEYGAQWQSFFPLSNTGGYVNPNKPVVTIVSSGVRPNAPTILDVVYKVTSTKPTVKVRALAYEDGERSLAKVTRPETFVADTNGVATAGNIGDAIAANVEHTLSWQVSSDFKTDLAKMKFEVLAVEDDILPLEFITIPANGSNKAMELSWNLMTESQVFDALLWLYAAKTEGLTLESGVLKVNGVKIASGTSIMSSSKNAYSSYNDEGSYVYIDSSTYSEAWKSAPKYVFEKMGYSALSGTNLTYANDMTRMGLSPSGIRQYAYRWVEQ